MFTDVLTNSSANVCITAGDDGVAACATCATDAAATRSSHTLHKRSPARSCVHCLVLYPPRDLYSSPCMHCNCFGAFRAAIWPQSLPSSCKNPRCVNSTYQPAACTHRMPAVKAAVDACGCATLPPPQATPSNTETCAATSGTIPLRLCVRRDL